MKQITPIIRKIRTNVEEYEVCPHCQEEIREKSTYIDEENYVYHRACQDKGPINKIKPLTPEQFQDLFGRKQTVKIANEKYDPKEIELGIEIESEHKNLYNFFKSFCDKHNLAMPLSKKEMFLMITKQHLDEMPNYNSRLKNMENKEDNKLEKKLEASLKCKMKLLKQE